jgi:hypothetical protein
MKELPVWVERTKKRQLSKFSDEQARTLEAYRVRHGLRSWNAAICRLIDASAESPQPPSPDVRQRIENWALNVENLQDALAKVEWVRDTSTTKRAFLCAFCHGRPIEDGGEDHVEGCEWQRLQGLNPKALRDLLQSLPPAQEKK